MVGAKLARSRKSASINASYTSLTDYTRDAIYILVNDCGYLSSAIDPVPNISVVIGIKTRRSDHVTCDAQRLKTLFFAQRNHLGYY